MTERLETKAAISVNDDGEISGIAWVFDAADRMGDRILKGAFKAAPKSLPILWMHDHRNPIGVWDEIRETERGLEVKGRLLVKDVESAREARALIRSGAARGLSVGFYKKKFSRRRGGGRDIAELDLSEISVVSVPAHPEAQILSVKHLKGNDMDDETIDAPETPEHKDYSSEIAELKSLLESTTKSFTDLKADHQKLATKLNRPNVVTKTADPGEEKAATERKAFTDYLMRGMQAETKSLIASSDPNGGYLVPEQETSEFIRNLVEFSPMHSIASVRSTSAPSVIYPKRTGITNAVWHGEQDDRTGSQPAFGQHQIDVKQISTYVEISKQLLEDAATVEAEVRLALAEDFGQKESLAFVSGTGGAQPKGFLNDAGISHTLNGHASNLSADALITLMYALPAAYRSRGSWVMNGNTLAVVRKLKDGQNNYLWQPAYAAGQPETILGRPVVEFVDMPDVEADALPIFFGDWQGAYRIIDRTNMSVLVDPYTKATSGLTVYHATRRVGGGLMKAEALRSLKMATS